MKTSLLALLFVVVCYASFGQKSISSQEMKAIYEEVKTPYKYGLVLVPEDTEHKMDCPTVFRKGKNGICPT
jgi:hypothetical protein